MCNWFLTRMQSKSCSPPALACSSLAQPPPWRWTYPQVSWHVAGSCRGKDSDATFANRNGRVFGRAGDRLRGRYATPAEFTRHDVKVWDVHRSRTIFCRPALNPRVTIRNSFASLYADKRRPVGLTRGGTLQTWAPSGSCAWRWWALGAGHTQCKNSHTLPIHPYIRGMPGPVGGIMVMPVCVMQTWAPSGSCAWRWWARRSPGRWARCACWSSPRAPRTRSRVTTRCRPSSRSCA
jgi:hypothetical protein